MDGRDNKTQQLLPDPDKFPDGISGLADKVHNLGLKIGIYSSAGTLTCADYPASIGYESIDAATWAAWGIDCMCKFLPILQYLLTTSEDLKYDNCNVPKNWTDECEACTYSISRPQDFVNGTCIDSDEFCPTNYDYTKSNTAERYAIMRDALQAQNRTIQYSICVWGYAGVQQWGNATGNSWRMSTDIRGEFHEVSICRDDEFL